MLNRIEKVRKKISENGLDAFLFSSSSNLFYLSRFNSSNAYILLLKEKGYYLTDARYYEGAKSKIKGLEVLLLDKNNRLKEVLNSTLSDNDVKKIGFEKDRLTLSFYEKLREDLKDYELIGYEGFLNDIRMVKSEEEIDTIKAAVEKIDEIFSQLIKELDRFDTELSVRRRIVDLIFEKGGTSESFPTIVATGEHSAVPHWETSSSRIENNSPLLIDMGMRLDGYCSDFTRTIFLGNPNKKLLDIYNIVKEAHLEATNVVKAGIPISDIDKKARSIIEKYGYGDYFTHSTGHGIGVDIHEEPRIYKDNQDELQENTVFTIEPGIYIPGLGGVRIENIVVARKNGPEVLTKTPLEPVIL